MADLANIRRALVVGLGQSGRAAATALASRGVKVTVVDDDPNVTSAGLADEVVVEAGRSGTSFLGQVDLVVPSPGVPDHAPVVAQALDAGLPVWSEPELAWQLAPRRILAVTGAHGKTATTEMAAAMLAAAGVEAVACGNTGTALTVAALHSDPDATLVVALSSSQLRHAHTLRPEVGAVLNLDEPARAGEDHLAGTRRLWQAQDASGWALVNADDERTIEVSAAAPGQRAVFSGQRLPGQDAAGGSCGIEVGVGVRHGKFVSTIPQGRGTVLAVRDLALTSPHHLSNVAAATALAILAGASHEAIASAASQHRPGRHRREIVASGAGVSWIDDSASTTPEGVLATLDGVRSAVWIAGGLDQDVDLRRLSRSLGRVRHAILIGDAAPVLAELCAAAGVAADTCDSLDAACALAASIARPGDAVLLSPGCAAFDQFRDYVDRGEHFVRAARQHANT